MHSASMEFEFDSRKAAANLEKHRVSFDEAMTALLDPQALAGEDRMLKVNRAGCSLASVRKRTC